MLPNFSYVRPRSVEEAVRLSSTPGARLHAGGTDLLGSLHVGVMPAEKVVSLSGIEHLKGITPLDEGVRIGALTTLAEISANAMLAARYPAVTQAAASAASPQLRNQGTIAGNLCQRPRCWYFRGDFHCLRKGGDNCFAINGDNEFHGILGGSGCVCVHPSDLAPALMALDASLRIAGPKGSRIIPLDAFFVLPERALTRETVLEAGEIVTDVLLPAATAGLHSSYTKIKAREAWAFAIVGAAVALRLNGGKVEYARIVLSGVAPAPWRATDAEKVLLGHRLNPERIALSAKAATTGAIPLSGNEYKLPMVRGVVEEALEKFV